MIRSETHPLVSVLICTNRDGAAAKAVRSVLECGFDSLEVLVIDQSTADSTEEAVLESRRLDPRVRYFRVASTGKPLALNFAFANARGRYVLLTDDDCEVERGWAAAIVRAFEYDERVGCVFGDVSAPPYDTSAGYVPVCPIEHDTVIFRLSEFLTMPGMRHFGIGANMALRADVLATLNGWDPSIGPGAKFGSGDDVDLTVRVLCAGYAVSFCAAARVLHHGFRPNATLAPTFRRNGIGAGAVFAKHLKCGTVYLGSLRVLQEWTFTACRNLIAGRHPVRASFSLGWLRGFQLGLRHPVDRRSAMFTADAPDRPFASPAPPRVEPSPRPAASSRSHIL